MDGIIVSGLTHRATGRGYLSADHISTATGLDPAFTISKNGGNFANPAAGASVMTEIEATGWYYFALTAGDTDTIGPLICRGTHATMDNIEVVYQVVSGTRGLAGTALPAAAADGAGGVPIIDGTGVKLTKTVDLTAGQSIACSDKTGFSLSATGADLIIKSSTFIQAIAAAISEFATYGLTALNTLLVTTGIKTASTAAPADMALNSTVGKEATLTSLTNELVKVPKSDSNVTWNATALASINTEAKDVIATDTIAEMAQGIPPATPTPLQALMYLYMAWRNRRTTTATQTTVQNDAGTVIAKAPLGDDATTFTKSEYVSGP